jgi:DHA1 family bicyclomycin/chloramphenicol resistance-like MFS transporter
MLVNDRSAARAPDQRVRPGHVLALGGLSSFGPLALDLCLPGLPMLAHDLRTTSTAAQLSMSCCMIGLALGQVIAGPLTDRLGRRRILLPGVALFSVAAALCAVAPSIEVLLVLRLLGGLGGGAGIVVARSMARDLYTGPALARVYSLLMTLVGAAPVVASVLAGQLLRVADWRGLHATAAAFGVLLVLTAATQRESLPEHRRRRAGAASGDPGLRALLADRRFLTRALVLGLGLCGMFTYITMGSFVLHQFYGLDPEAIAAVSALTGLGIVVFSQVGAALSRRVGAGALLAVGVHLALAAAVAMLVGVALSAALPALLVPLVVLVACTGLIGPNATALALDERSERTGAAAAVLGLAQFGTAAIIPPLAALGGISPVVMAATVVATTIATAAVHAVGALTTAGSRPVPPAPDQPAPAAAPRPAPVPVPTTGASVRWRGDRGDAASEDVVRRLMQDEQRRRQWRRDAQWAGPAQHGTDLPATTRWIEPK